MTNLVFVYGSLKKGYTNHQLLKHAELLSEGRTHGIMLHLGGFPAIVDGKAQVFGELYKVTPEILATLDRLEGHPHFYERRLVTIKPIDQNDGEYLAEAWCYFLSRDSQEHYQVLCPIIKNGTWNGPAT